MKRKHLTLALLITLKTFISLGQSDSLPQQIVVRLNFNYLNKNVVNDRTILRGKIESILN